MLPMSKRLQNMKAMMQRNDERFQAMEVKRCRSDKPYYIVEVCKGRPNLGNGRYTRHERLDGALKAATWEWSHRAQFGVTQWDHVTIYKCVHDVSDAVCWADGVTIGNGL